MDTTDIPQPTGHFTKLKNGSVEPSAIVLPVTLALTALLDDNVIVFYELVMKARDPNHPFFSPGVEQDLKKTGLLQENGVLNDRIRNIVLSATEGDGLDMHLIDPVLRS